MIIIERIMNIRNCQAQNNQTDPIIVSFQINNNSTNNNADQGNTTRNKHNEQQEQINVTQQTSTNTININTQQLAVMKQH